MHHPISPAILYWGTPVVLVSTENEDGTSNIGPISSAFWLGHRCMLGINASAQTTKNLLRTKQCVLNLPSDDMGDHVNALARTTGNPDVPPRKKDMGYRHEKDKFGVAGLTPMPSDYVRPPRIQECPVHMEAELMNKMEVMQDLPDRKGAILALEVKILRTHAEDAIRLEGHANRINPDAWRPMIMSFSHLYGLRDNQVVDSKLAKIDEEKYRVMTRSDVVRQGGDMDSSQEPASEAKKEVTPAVEASTEELRRTPSVVAAQA